MKMIPGGFESQVKDRLAAKDAEIAKLRAVLEHVAWLENWDFIAMNTEIQRLRAALEAARRHIVDGNLIHRTSVMRQIDVALANEQEGK
jgi:hypothetical protein